MDSGVIVAIAAVVLMAVFLPRVGALATFKARRTQRGREQVEDALKHLLDRQQRFHGASPDSLAGTLNLTGQQTLRVIESMEAQGLLQSAGSTLNLTAEGEEWALHVVRAHRLWERFLADEARMPLQRIHEEAQRREHASTPGQLDRMDAAMGHPARDPHGDPIPTRDGMRASTNGEPLTAWEIGVPAVIVHLEDEPAIAFEQIVAAGIRLGQTIRVLDRDPRRLVLSDGEQEFQLAPAAASNVHVVGLPASEQRRRTAVPLTEIAVGQAARILMLDEAVQGLTRRRLLDLGLTPGTRVQPELWSFFGDPRGYRVRGTLIALRGEQAATIWVQRLASAEISNRSAEFPNETREKTAP